MEAKVADMAELCRHDAALRSLDQVRTQLVDAAAFGKIISPERLEMAASKVAEARRVLAERSITEIAAR
ncbi:DUF6374 family protein [Nocardia cyriacigeorgica]|uniref:DUF6374 family protein n=1 Tax=Nocardia cyriacigeorgica TaxID=135487 RepID=UPI0035B5E0FD